MSREWYNENETRAYPIREDASCLDTLGRQLPNDILADLAISLPETLLDDVFISSVALSSRMVSVIVATATEGLLVATLPRPVPLYEPQALQPLVDNVSGFIVFGTGANNRPAATYRFASVAQTPLALKAVRVFSALPVTLIGKIGAPTELRGIITLDFGTNIEWRFDPAANRIYLGLVEAVRSEFVGPCARQDAISGCGVPPIRSINGVTADASGAIFIEVD